ncbi:MAG: MBL fold metallo-hydrolase [Chloroflexi bacterium]|nr:MBL fold metallo-hydrolase [Chloroflexota bacterium]
MWKINKVHLGTNAAYLIKGDDGYVMVDGGNHFTFGIFKRFLRGNHIRPDEIKLVVVTHAHFDHVGILHDIKELTGCQVAVHEAESHLLRDGTVVIPPGTNLLGKIASTIGWKIKRIFQFEKVDPEIKVTGVRSLEDFGLDAKIIPTPGHTEGSLSVLLSSGEAFIGDLAISFRGFGSGILPPVGGSVDTMVSSWNKLLRAGAKHIYPGHFKSFPSEIMRKEHAWRTTAPAAR